MYECNIYILIIHVLYLDGDSAGECFSRIQLLLVHGGELLAQNTLLLLEVLARFAECLAQLHRELFRSFLLSHLPDVC